MTTLTQQQTQAIGHLHQWKVGALFMEPGTGKTRVALTLVNSTPCTDIFWVGPLRTLDTIRQEVAKWGGFKMEAHYYGVESISQSGRIYLQLHNEVKNSHMPFIVIDESLKIKNATAKRTQRMLQISQLTEWKMVLNGTPVSRNLLDMWPQMEFLSPKILNMSLATFKNTFCNYTTVTKRIGGRQYTREFITGMENIDYLHSLIRHYVYECDLKMNITQKWHTVQYEISPDNYNRYLELKDYYLSDETLEWKNNNIFFAMTTQMQMAYCTDQAKVEAVREILQQHTPEKTIIFCRYIMTQELCRQEFPKCQVLSMQKSSLGLNLQDCNTTIYFDKVWDYALYIQSTRRTYRTGQEQDCQYYELTGDVGLEQLIDRNIRKKITMSEYLKKVTLEELKKEL